MNAIHSRSGSRSETQTRARLLRRKTKKSLEPDPRLADIRPRALSGCLARRGLSNGPTSEEDDRPPAWILSTRVHDSVEPIAVWSSDKPEVFSDNLRRDVLDMDASVLLDRPANVSRKSSKKRDPLAHRGCRMKEAWNERDAREIKKFQISTGFELADVHKPGV